MASKAQAFRKLMNAPGYFTLMEAHNGLSAKVVEETGFPAIWASGLSITASLGVRDNNEISYTQLMDVLEYMNDACDIPILVDGDTGYGNFNNARTFVRKLENRGIAAVCIEDKKFPKTNSFLETKLDALAPIDEFVGKIKAIKDFQLSPDFTLVARLESLIVGAGLEDALKRAEAYVGAGADALLVHSKRSDGQQIYEFLEHFKGEVPIFLVPTKYYSEPVAKLTADKRVKGLIWANQNIRTSLLRMRQTCQRIFEDGTIAGVEDTIASVADIFEIQGNEEYMRAEEKYLPAGPNVKAFVMAAGDPGELQVDVPKAMISINGQTILERQLEAFQNNGIQDITVVRGFEKEKIQPGKFKVIDNDNWRTTGPVASMALAVKDAPCPYIVTFGDVFFKRYLLREMMDMNKCDVTLVCVQENYIKNNYYLKTDQPPRRFEENQSLAVVDVRQGEGGDDADSVYFSGLMMVHKPEVVARVLAAHNAAGLHMRDLLRLFIEQNVKLGAVVATTDSVVDVNSAQDILTAGELN